MVIAVKEKINLIVLSFIGCFHFTVFKLLQFCFSLEGGWRVVFFSLYFFFRF